MRRRPSAEGVRQSCIPETRMELGEDSSGPGSAGHLPSQGSCVVSSLSRLLLEVLLRRKIWVPGRGDPKQGGRGGGARTETPESGPCVSPRALRGPLTG